MEKRGVIAPGWTPPEALEDDEQLLDEHVTKRAADVAQNGLTPSVPEKELTQHGDLDL